MLEPGPVGAEQLVGPPPFAGDSRRDLEDPARRDPLDVATQVARGARTERDAMRRPGPPAAGGAGVRRWLDRSGSSSPVASRSWSGSSESSWVGDGNSPSARPRTTTRSRSRPTPMEIEPTSTPSPIRPTRPRSASSSSSMVRVNTSRADRRLDGVQAGQAVEGALDPFGRLLLGQGPGGPPPLAAEESRQMPTGPGHPVPPRLGLVRPPGPGRRSGPGRMSADRAPGSRISAGAARLATSVRRDLPRRASASASKSSAKVARRRSQSRRPPTTPASREIRSQAVTGMAPPSRRSRAPANQAKTSSRRKPALGELEQLEQRAARHPGRERHHRRPVEGDAGGGQLLVGQPGVGLGAGVEDGDPVQRRPRPCRIDDGPDGRPDLLVAVGHGDDPRPLGVRPTPSGRSPPASSRRRVSGDAPHRQLDLGVGPCIAGRPGQHDQITPLGDGPEELTAVARQPFGKVDDDSAETIDRRGSSVRRISTAASIRSSSSYHSATSRARADRWRRTTSAARSLRRASASRAPSERSRSSR